MNLGLPVPDLLQDTSTAIARMLRDGEIDEATRLFDRAVKRWPKSSKLLLLKGELLGRTSGPSQAAAHYSELLNASNVSQWAAGHLLATLRDAPLPVDDAAAVTLRVCAAQLEAPLKERILDRLLDREDPSERARILEAAGRNSAIFRYEWKFAVSKTENGDFDAAIEILELAQSAGRNSVQGCFLLAELLAVCSRLPDAVALLEDLLRRQPDQTDIYRRLTNLLQRACDFERAADVFESAATRWPHDWMLVFRFNRLPIKPHRQSGILTSCPRQHRHRR